MKEIIIWGVGVTARSLYYKISTELWGGGIKFEVKYFVDNAPIDKFYGLNVYRPTRENCSKYLVVVASRVYYEDISHELTEFGLEELYNYIPFEALGKKIVLLHGNCHTDIIKRYLNTSKTFIDRYWIYPLPMIQNNKKGYIKDHLLKNCDVFICQDIRESNPYDIRLSAEYLLERSGGTKILFPNLFGLGKIIFPQSETGVPREGDMWNNPRGVGIEGGLFNYRDVNIDRLWNGGERDIHKIAEYLESDIYEEKWVRDNFKRIIEKWEQRETLCDIKVLHYIQSEYQKTQLFWEPAHPCNVVFKKLSGEILRLLKISESELGEIDFSFGVAEMPIYKCVRRALGLQYENESIRNTPPVEMAKLTEEEMDLEEYVREYCYWCFDYL